MSWRITLRTVALVCIALTVQGLAGARAETRLDSRVRPTFEQVTLDIDAREADYSGSVRIELVAEQQVDAFSFHAEEMTLDKVVLTDNKGQAIGVTIEDDPEGYGLRHATTEKPLKKGTYVLEIEFSKEYNTRAVGLYKVNFEGNGYLFTQFEAIDARKAFPCWDEPIYKIPFQLTLTVPMAHEAVSNTPVEKQVNGADDKTLVFKKTKPMPTYLIAIAAGPLESVAIKNLSVPGRIYTCKGQKALTKFGADKTPEILAALEDYFGRPYPYEKLDYIAIPEYWPGAMENVGAITFSDKVLLIDSEAASVNQKRTCSRVIAHEIAHMWFGDLVTMAWWDDLWLNEAFADWMGDKITDQLYPEYELPMSELRQVQNIMEGDARPSTKPIRRPVTGGSDIMEDIGLPYYKGKTMLRMVEMWIGEENFKTGVRNYINEFAWGNTVAEDLFSALSTAADDDLSPILSSFLDQSGYPMVSVEAGRGGIIKMSQKRFLNHGIEGEERSWTVPIRVKYSDGENIHRRTVLLDKESVQIEVGGNVEWVMPDESAVGYYRWIAPPEMLFKIAESAATDLDKPERAKFIGNAKALLDAGALGGDDFLTLLHSFSTDKDASIVSQVITSLGAVHDAFLYDGIDDAFASYVRQTLRPALDRYGMAPKPGEADAVALLRPRLIDWLGRSGRDADVIAYCKKVAAQYLEDPSSVDPTLAGSVLNVSVIDGTREDFEMYRKRFETTSVPAERGRYLSALGRFQNPEIRALALEYANTDAVRPTEYFQLIGGMELTEAGQQQVFEWMMDTYEVITSRIPPDFAGYMPYFVTGCSAERLQKAREFFAQPEHQVAGTERNLEKVAEGITDCLNLRAREGEKVAEYLSELASR